MGSPRRKSLLVNDGGVVEDPWLGAVLVGGGMVGTASP